MVAASQCKNPLQGWSGKVWDIQIWKNAFEKRPFTFSLYTNVLDDSYDRRRLRNLDTRKNNSSQYIYPEDENVEPSTHDDFSNKSKALLISHTVRKPVIFWASHHKTGTYFAQKMFSLLCGRMGWCCVFLVTRDTIHSLQNALESDHNVRVIGHNQWIWYPELLGVPYRFIHFYRHPYRKVSSGYWYHLDGTEGWTKRPQLYSQLCESDLYKVSKQRNADTEITRNMVIKHCQNIHLCQTCCRKEHEMVEDYENTTYRLRQSHEYDFLCQFLGKNIAPEMSLQEALLANDPATGIMIEAAVDYYETLRMARIFNHTYRDKHSLNVDLDSMSHDFEGVVRRILLHLDLGLSISETNSIVTDVNFFDLNNSPLYAWSMAGHVNQGHGGSSNSSGIEYDKLVALNTMKQSKDFQQTYRHIMDLMHAVTSVKK